MSPFLDAIDLLRSAPLRNELPGVEAAFDETVMRRHLQAALLGKSGNGNAIARCERRQAVYDPDHGCVVRYALEVCRGTGRPLGQALASACLFPSARSSRRYFETRLRPLAAAMRGRPDVAAFSAPAALLEPLSMAVTLFPIDADLPTLVAATDPTVMLEILRGALDRGTRPKLAQVRCRVDVAHYPRQHHCVLRYTLGGEGDAPPATVFGKIAWDDRASLTAAALPELRERLDRMRPRRFAVPRLLGLVQALRLVLLEPMPGAPLVLALLRERLGAGGAPGTPTLEDAVEQAAAVAAGLHRSGVGRGRQRGIHKERAELKQALTVLDRFSPGLGAEYRDWVGSVKALAAASEPLPACFSHGDFSPSQLLFSSDQCSLIDFDTICQAEPALDLGQFLAYLRLAARKIGEPASAGGRETTEQICARFVDAYVRECGLGAGAESLLRRRVRLYEIVSLLRLVFHSWRKFKSERLAFATELVRDRLGVLARRPT
jgi:phosphotransferase family enzyme